MVRNSHREQRMTQDIDRVDQQVLHAMMSDARNISAPMIAETLSVSGGTVRNRIDRLEQEGVIQGYTAIVDFEQVGCLTSVFMCTVPADKREELAVAAKEIPSVINVRVLMAGRRDLQIVAVGETTEDLREIAKMLAALDIQIENEELIQTEIQTSYEPFSTRNSVETPARETVTPRRETTVTEVPVSQKASIAGMSIKTARNQGILPQDAVIVSVERGDGGHTIQPTEETVIKGGDTVTVVPTEDSGAETLAAFNPECRPVKNC